MVLTLREQLLMVMEGVSEFNALPLESIKKVFSDVDDWDVVAELETLVTERKVKEVEGEAGVRYCGR